MRENIPVNGSPLHGYVVNPCQREKVMITRLRLSNKTRRSIGFGVWLLVLAGLSSSILAQVKEIEHLPAQTDWS